MTNMEQEGSKNRKDYCSKEQKEQKLQVFGWEESSIFTTLLWEWFRMKQIKEGKAAMRERDLEVAGRSNWGSCGCI